MKKAQKKCENDRLLWSQLKRGNNEALGIIFLEQYDDLYAYGIKLVKNENFVRDTIQDLFVKLWTSNSKLRDVVHIKPYLIKAFRNLIIDQTRTNQRISEILFSELNDNVSFEIADFKTDSDIEQEQISKLLLFLNNLPPRIKEALYLRYFIGLDFNDLSDVMNVNVQSVRNMISQGIRLLKKQFFILIIVPKFGIIF
jgi:RNA polymerase sigma factor (sigma-70 family)